jgi:riboflavin synthase
VFTGIVEELGEVVGLEPNGDSARLVVRGPRVTGDAARGDSIAVNGVCLTVTESGHGEFAADVIGETLKHSTLGSLAAGTAVNLERPVRPDGRLGGHVVQGHVDGTGTILSRQPGTDWEVVRISVPPELARYVVYKGSVAVDGISLTVSGLADDRSPDHGTSDHGAPDHGASDHGDCWFEVSLIPETLQRTTLGFKQPGAAVNLEVDLIAKYVERLLAGRRS